MSNLEHSYLDHKLLPCSRKLPICKKCGNLYYLINLPFFGKLFFKDNFCFPVLIKRCIIHITTEPFTKSSGYFQHLQIFVHKQECHKCDVSQSVIVLVLLYNCWCIEPEAEKRIFLLYVEPPNKSNNGHKKKSF